MKNENIRFYDTCALLIDPERIFQRDGKIMFSRVTLEELEHIKTAANKDADVKYSARLIQRLLERYPDRYSVTLGTKANEEVFKLYGTNADAQILAEVAYVADAIGPVDFFTNDLALKHIAADFAQSYCSNLHIKKVFEDEDDTYCGYLEICPTDDELSRFYSNLEDNLFALYINQYLILKNSDNKVIDIYRWDGCKHVHIPSQLFVSSWFGKVAPYNHDIYQQLLCDSLVRNKITMARGPAGSGKSYLALAYLMSLLQKNSIDKIIIFCNTVATANSAKLGFYPGSKDEKLLDSQIGNFLSSKFGGKEGAIEMIEQGKLVLLPFSDLRGYDTTGMRAGIYITEAQNLDRSLMKLALQRIGEDCVCIIDGDDTSQVDMKAYEGSNNGMRRLSKIFRGHDIYGEVTLKNIYRSRIAEIADKI